MFARIIFWQLRQFINTVRLSVWLAGISPRVYTGMVYTWYILVYTNAQKAIPGMWGVARSMWGHAPPCPLAAWQRFALAPFRH